MKPATLALCLVVPLLAFSSPSLASPALVVLADVTVPPIVVPDEHDLKQAPPKKPNARKVGGDRRYAAPQDWSPTEQDLKEIRESHEDLGVAAPAPTEAPYKDRKGVPKPPVPEGSPAPGVTPAPGMGPGASPVPTGPRTASPAPAGQNSPLSAPASTAPTLAPPRLENTAPPGAPSVPNIPVAPPVSVPGPGGT